MTMFLEKVKSEGLAHLSYILGHNGQAVVIDPRRDCQTYIDIARQNGARITHIFETHRNEDYVAGSTNLARRTGAEIYHGKNLDFSYGKLAADRSEPLTGQPFEVLAGPHAPSYTKRKPSRVGDDDERHRDCLALRWP